MSGEIGIKHNLWMILCGVLFKYYICKIIFERINNLTSEIFLLFREKFLVLREQLQKKAEKNEEKRVQEHRDAMSKRFISREHDMANFVDKTRYKTQVHEAAKLASEVSSNRIKKSNDEGNCLKDVTI